MAKKPKISEQQTVEEVVVVDELESFKLSVTQMTAETLNSYKDVIDGEFSKRRHVELDKVAEIFKTLPFGEQKLFLDSIRATLSSKRKLADSDDEKPSKEKDPFRMYKNYPSDDNPLYKVALLVNLELKEIFTGGNPQHTVWLATLSKEERKRNYGTIEKLEINSDFLNELITVPRAVFKQKNGQWVDCYPG
jgi:hypothetical protein